MGMSCFITSLGFDTNLSNNYQGSEGIKHPQCPGLCGCLAGPGRRSGLGWESRVVEIRRYLLSAFCGNEESPHILPRNKTESVRAFMRSKALHGGEVSLRLPSMADPVRNMSSRLLLQFRKGVLYENPMRMPASQVPPFIS